MSWRQQTGRRQSSRSNRAQYISSSSTPSHISNDVKESHRLSGNNSDAVNEYSFTHNDLSRPQTNTYVPQYLNAPKNLRTPVSEQPREPVTITTGEHGFKIPSVLMSGPPPSFQHLPTRTSGQQYRSNVSAFAQALPYWRATASSENVEEGSDAILDRAEKILQLRQYRDSMTRSVLNQQSAINSTPFDYPNVVQPDPFPGVVEPARPTIPIWGPYGPYGPPKPVVQSPPFPIPTPNQPPAPPPISRPVEVGPRGTVYRRTPVPAPILPRPKPSPPPPPSAPYPPPPPWRPVQQSPPYQVPTPVAPVGARSDVRSNPEAFAPRVPARAAANPTSIYPTVPTASSAPILPLYPPTPGISYYPIRGTRPIPYRSPVRPQPSLFTNPPSASTQAAISTVADEVRADTSDAHVQQEPVAALDALKGDTPIVGPANTTPSAPMLIIPVQSAASAATQEQSVGNATQSVSLPAPIHGDPEHNLPVSLVADNFPISIGSNPTPSPTYSPSVPLSQRTHQYVPPSLQQVTPPPQQRLIRDTSPPATLVQSGARGQTSTRRSTRSSLASTVFTAPSPSASSAATYTAEQTPQAVESGPRTTTHPQPTVRSDVHNMPATQAIQSGQRSSSAAAADADSDEFVRNYWASSHNITPVPAASSSATGQDTHDFRRDAVRSVLSTSAIAAAKKDAASHRIESHPGIAADTGHEERVKLRREISRINKEYKDEAELPPNATQAEQMERQIRQLTRVHDSTVLKEKYDELIAYKQGSDAHSERIRGLTTSVQIMESINILKAQMQLHNQQAAVDKLRVDTLKQEKDTIQAQLSTAQIMLDRVEVDRRQTSATEAAAKDKALREWKHIGTAQGAEIERLRLGNADIQQRAQATEAQATQFIHQLHAEVARVQQAAASAANFDRATIEEVEQRAVAAEGLIGEAAKQIQQVQTDARMANSQLQQLTTQYSELHTAAHSTVTQLTQQRDTLQSNFNIAEDQLKTATEKLGLDTSTVDSWKQGVTKAAEQLQGVNERVKQLQDSHMETQGALQAQVLSITADLAKANKSLQSTQMDLFSTQNTLTAHKESTDRAMAEYEREAMEEAEKHAFALHTAAVTHVRTTTAREAEFAQHIASLTAKAAQEVQTLQSQLSEANSALTFEYDKVSKMQEQYEQLQASSAATAIKLIASDAALVTLRADIQSKEAELTTARASITKLTGDAVDATNTHASAIATLQQTHETARAAAVAAETTRMETQYSIQLARANSEAAQVMETTRAQHELEMAAQRKRVEEAEAARRVPVPYMDLTDNPTVEEVAATHGGVTDMQRLHSILSGSTPTVSSLHTPPVETNTAAAPGISDDTVSLQSSIAHQPAIIVPAAPLRTSTRVPQSAEQHLRETVSRSASSTAALNAERSTARAAAAAQANEGRRQIPSSLRVKSKRKTAEIDYADYNDDEWEEQLDQLEDDDARAAANEVRDAQIKDRAETRAANSEAYQAKKERHRLRNEAAVARGRAEGRPETRLSAEAAMAKMKAQVADGIFRISSRPFGTYTHQMREPITIKTLPTPRTNSASGGLSSNATYVVDETFILMPTRTTRTIRVAVPVKPTDDTKGAQEFIEGTVSNREDAPKTPTDQAVQLLLLYPDMTVELSGARGAVKVLAKELATKISRRLATLTDRSQKFVAEYLSAKRAMDATIDSYMQGQDEFSGMTNADQDTDYGEESTMEDTPIEPEQRTVNVGGNGFSSGRGALHYYTHPRNHHLVYPVKAGALFDHVADTATNNIKTMASSTIDDAQDSVVPSVQHVQVGMMRAAANPFDLQPVPVNISETTDPSTAAASSSNKSVEGGALTFSALSSSAFNARDFASALDMIESFSILDTNAYNSLIITPRMVLTQQEQDEVDTPSDKMNKVVSDDKEIANTISLATHGGSVSALSGLEGRFRDNQEIAIAQISQSFVGLSTPMALRLQEQRRDDLLGNKEFNELDYRVKAARYQGMGYMQQRSGLVAQEYSSNGQLLQLFGNDSDQSTTIADTNRQLKLSEDKYVDDSAPMEEMFNASSRSDIQNKQSQVNQRYATAMEEYEEDQELRIAAAYTAFVEGFKQGSSLFNLALTNNAFFFDSSQLCPAPTLNQLVQPLQILIAQLIAEPDKLNGILDYGKTKPEIALNTFENAMTTTLFWSRHLYPLFMNNYSYHGNLINALIQTIAYSFFTCVKNLLFNSKLSPTTYAKISYNLPSNSNLSVLFNRAANMATGHNTSSNANRYAPKFTPLAMVNVRGHDTVAVPGNNDAPLGIGNGGIEKAMMRAKIYTDRQNVSGYRPYTDRMSSEDNKAVAPYLSKCEVKSREIYYKETPKLPLGTIPRTGDTGAPFHKIEPQAPQDPPRLPFSSGRITLKRDRDYDKSSPSVIATSANSEDPRAMNIAPAPVPIATMQDALRNVGYSSLPHRPAKQAVQQRSPYESVESDVRGGDFWDSMADAGADVLGHLAGAAIFGGTLDTTEAAVEPTELGDTPATSDSVTEGGSLMSFLKYERRGHVRNPKLDEAGVSHSKADEWLSNPAALRNTLKRSGYALRVKRVTKAVNKYPDGTHRCTVELKPLAPGVAPVVGAKRVLQYLNGL